MKIKNNIFIKLAYTGIFYACFIAPFLHFYIDYRAFQINREASIIEFIEAFLMLSIAYFIYYEFYKKKKNKLFFVLSVLFVFMAFDDFFGIHETFGTLLSFIEIVQVWSESYFGTDPRALGELIYFGTVFGIFFVYGLNNFHKTDKFEQNFLISILGGLIFLFITGVVYDFLHRTDILTYKAIANIDLVFQDFIEDYLELLTICYLYLITHYFVSLQDKKHLDSKIKTQTV